MAKPRDPANKGELIPFEETSAVAVLPPNSGVVGRFLEETQNMFKARAMRMGGLLRRINESGQRTEALLKMAAETMEAAEAALEQQFHKEGLIHGEGDGTNSEDT